MFHEAASGLDLTLARAYDPQAGRWLTRDPLGEGTDPYGNLYAYVQGNPVSLTDPLGLIVKPFGPGGPFPAPTPPGGGGGAGSGNCQSNPPPAPIPSANPPPNGSAAGRQEPSPQQVAVTFGHGARHVEDPAAAESEILQNLPNPAEIGGPFWGITPNYIYRAYPLPNGDLNIGTYYYR